jgi:hypothetical protein
MYEHWKTVGAILHNIGRRKKLTLDPPEVPDVRKRPWPPKQGCLAVDDPSSASSPGYDREFKPVDWASVNPDKNLIPLVDKKPTLDDIFNQPAAHWLLHQVVYELFTLPNPVIPPLSQIYSISPLLHVVHAWYRVSAILGSFDIEGQDSLTIELIYSRIVEKALGVQAEPPTLGCRPTFSMA